MEPSQRHQYSLNVSVMMVREKYADMRNGPPPLALSLFTPVPIKSISEAQPFSVVVVSQFLMRRYDCNARRECVGVEWDTASKLRRRKKETSITTAMQTHIIPAPTQIFRVARAEIRTGQKDARIERRGGIRQVDLCKGCWANERGGKGSAHFASSSFLKGRAAPLLLQDAREIAVRKVFIIPYRSQLFSFVQVRKKQFVSGFLTGFPPLPASKLQGLGEGGKPGYLITIRVSPLFPC